MRVIDAFAGIGGFSLAADALGWETVAFVERDKDCQFWLAQHWPNVPIYDDVTTVRWEDAPPCDVFTAGFPCQPHSVAGKRQASADDRDLWSECVRAIGVLRPRYAVLENVPGLLTSESGRFFNRVLSDLAALGYVGRYDVLSAAECGAPHKRERVWIVAHPEGQRVHGRAEQTGRCRSDRHRDGVGDTDDEQCEKHGDVGQPVGADVTGSGPDRVEHAANIGCDEREQEPQPGQTSAPRKRADVGHADSSRREQDSVSTELRTTGDQQRSVVSWSARPREAKEIAARNLRNPWADAIPCRGADGTVRLIPAGAVAESSVSGLSQRDGAGAGSARSRDAESEHSSGFVQQEEVSWPEPALRALADGIPHNLAGRHAAEEAKPWPTATVTSGSQHADHPTPGQTGGTTLMGAVDAFASTAGASLWPVTDSEPGRVARLRAVGNAVVPAWVLAGPFRYILDREASQ